MYLNNLMVKFYLSSSDLEVKADSETSNFLLQAAHQQST